MPLLRNIEAPPPKSSRRFVEPTKDPVSVEDVKIYSRIDAGDQDFRIRSLIKAATRRAEDFTRRAFLSQQWRITFDALPFGTFTIPDTPRIVELPRPELISLDKVRTFDEDDVEAAFALTNLYIDSNSEPARARLRDDASWPSGLRSIDAIYFEYTSGYGTNPTDVPDEIREAILRIIATRYEHREDTVAGVSVNQIPETAMDLLGPFRIMQL